MRGRIITLFVVAVFGNGPHAGEIYRCVAANGDLTYTNLTCPEKTQVQHIGSYEPVANSPVLTADAAAESAANSAHQAREAAEQAEAALLRQAQMAYMAYQEQADAQREAAYADAGDNYPAVLVPFYPYAATHLGDRHGRHHVNGERSPSHRMQSTGQQPHNQATGSTDIRHMRH
jgi:hypothetical protein